jgi:hypothetical protein
VVLATQLVEDRSADPRNGEGAECEPSTRVEALDRCHEPDRAGAHELVEIGVHGQALGELPSDMVHQIQVLEEQGVPG